MRGEERRGEERRGEERRGEERRGEERRGEERRGGEGRGERRGEVRGTLLHTSRSRGDESFWNFPSSLVWHSNNSSVHNARMSG